MNRWDVRASLVKAQSSALAAILTIAAQHAVSAATFDWPQWQGPNRTAHSKETGLLKEWPKAGPPLAWKIKGLGGGDSTPSVAAGSIYGMGNRGADEVVMGLSEPDGNERWAGRIAPASSQNLPQSQQKPTAPST